MIFSSGHHNSKISSEVVSKTICGEIKRGQNSTPWMGKTGGTQEEEREGGEDQERVWEEDEPQNKGGLRFVISCTRK